jgi:predicted nucleic acid-binding protein
MKIVVDANIFISAFFWGGNSRAVLERIITGIDELFITKEILDEINDVIMRPKFHADENEINFFINSIEEIVNNKGRCLSRNASAKTRRLDAR